MMSEIGERLQEVVGADGVIRDEAERAYYSQDAFWDGEVAALVIAPRSREDLARAVGIATAAGYAVVPRGGGMSYTGGYVPDRPGTVIVDCRRLDRSCPGLQFRDYCDRLEASDVLTLCTLAELLPKLAKLRMLGALRPLVRGWMLAANGDAMGGIYTANLLAVAERTRAVSPR